MIEISDIAMNFLRHGLPAVAVLAALVLGILCLRRKAVGVGLLTILSGLCLAVSKLYFVFVPIQTVTWEIIAGVSWRFESAKQLLGFFCLQVATSFSVIFLVIAMALLVWSFRANQRQI